MSAEQVHGQDFEGVSLGPVEEEDSRGRGKSLGPDTPFDDAGSPFLAGPTVPWP